MFDSNLWARLGRPVLGAALVAVATIGTSGPSVAEEAPAAPAAENGTHGVAWERDWTKATARAKAEGKDLLINFTGSDWCGWCIKLEEEVFSKGDFAQKAGEKFVFVFLDFPNDPALQKQVIDPATNQRLKKQYGVSGFPTIVLTNADGKAWAQLGYRRGGPEAYLSYVDEARTHRKTILDLDPATATAEALRGGFAALAKNGMQDNVAPGLYARARELDPDGTQGLRVHADRAEEKATFDKLVRTQTPDWNKLVAFMLNAKHMGDNQMFVQACVGVVEQHLLVERKFDSAEAVVERALALPVVKGEPGALKYLTDLLAKVQKLKAESTAPPAPAPGQESNGSGK